MKLKTKRFLSYILDMLILFIIMFMIGFLFKPSQNEILLGNLNETLVSKDISFTSYKNSYIELVQNIDQDNFIVNIISVIFIIILFIAVPKILKGQTIGQKILKLRINDNRLIKLISKSFFINGLAYMIFILLALYLVDNSVYFVLINFLGFCQVLLVIFNAFMILYKQDQLGMVDIITNTRIEEIK